MFEKLCNAELIASVLGREVTFLISASISTFGGSRCGRTVIVMRLRRTLWACALGSWSLLSGSRG